MLRELAVDASRAHPGISAFGNATPGSESLFNHGALTSVSHPKGPVLAVGFIPQFIRARAPRPALFALFIRRLSYVVENGRNAATTQPILCYLIFGT